MCRPSAVLVCLALVHGSVGICADDSPAQVAARQRGRARCNTMVEAKAEWCGATAMGAYEDGKLSGYLFASLSQLEGGYAFVLEHKWQCRGEGYASYRSASGVLDAQFGVCRYRAEAYRSQCYFESHVHEIAQWKDGVLWLTAAVHGAGQPKKVEAVVDSIDGFEILGLRAWRNWPVGVVHRFHVLAGVDHRIGSTETWQPGLVSTDVSTGARRREGARELVDITVARDGKPPHVYTCDAKTGDLVQAKLGDAFVLRPTSAAALAAWQDEQAWWPTSRTGR